MTFLHWLGSVFLAAGVLCAIRAGRISRQLRHLLLLHRRGGWKLESPSLNARDEFRLFDAERVLPPHWRRELHAERGARLVDQLYLSLIAAVGLLGLGLTLFDILASAG